MEREQNQPKRAVIRTSTIVVGAGRKNRVYRSLEEVPDRMRKRVVESTRGPNSATILIADRGGREEILNAVKQMRPGSRVDRPRRPDAPPSNPIAPGLSPWRDWAPIVGLGAIALAFWLLVTFIR